MLESLATDPLGPPGDRERIDALLAEFLGEARRHAANTRAASVFDRAAEFALRGGKRLRPLLALASYRILSGEAVPPRAVWAAASSLELFHAFMLAHDDLIDEGLTRRGRPSLHEAIRLDGGSADGSCSRKRAADLALVAGDLLCALGMRMLAGSGLEAEPLGRAHRLVADMLLETGVGEALDVLYEDCPLGSLGESELIDAYLGKTARYSVSGPLVMGATLAGAGRSACASLRRFGDLLGLVYQIRNDLDALDGADPCRECPDLDAGKRTWPLWAAHRLLAGSGRHCLDEALDAPPGPERRASMLRLIASSGAIGECLGRLDSLRREASAALRESPLDPSRRAAFGRLVSLFGVEPPAFADGSLDGSAFPSMAAEVAEGV